MPTVLITGLNGFVAVHTAVKFLGAGWTVRGTVRSKDKGEKILSLPLFEDTVKAGRLEYTVVQDLAAGDFTDALTGVDAVAHVASPCGIDGKSWATYRDPAVKGTTNVLEQARKFDSVKAVAVVSSVVAVADLSKPAHEQVGRVYTEDDWLPWTEEDVKDLSAEEGGSVMWYCASKKYAELAAREVHEKGAQYTIATLTPPVILGPAIHFGPGTTADDLLKADFSTMKTYTTLAGGKDAQVPEADFVHYVDVRTLSEAIIAVISRRVNGRYTISSGHFDWQTLANKAREFYPQFAQAGLIPVGTPEHTESSLGSYALDASKSVRILGIEYFPLDKTVRDTVDQFAKLGMYNA